MPERLEPVVNLIIDNRLDSYASFFDHDWAKSFGELSDKSRLQLPGCDLTRDWKGIAVAGRMPWLMIDSLQRFHVGFTTTNPPFYKLLTTHLGEYLLKRSKLSNMRKKELLGTLDGLREAAEREIERAGPAIDLEHIWREYLQIGEFGLALWNSQRISYSAVYFAFENFIQRTIAAGKHDDSYRSMRFSDLTADFTLLFGDALAEESLKDEYVDIARLVRNCLTHDGGRVSDKLRAKQHGLRVDDGEVHIMPENVRALFDLLKVRAMKIVEAATHLPEFAP